MDSAIVTCGHQEPDHTRKRKTKDAYIRVSLRTALQQACTITKQQYYVPVTVRVIRYRVCTLTVIPLIRYITPANHNAAHVNGCSTH